MLLTQPLQVDSNQPEILVSGPAESDKREKVAAPIGDLVRRQLIRVLTQFRLLARRFVDRLNRLNQFFR